LQNVLFPVYSRMQDDRKKAGEIYLAASCLLLLLLVPLCTMAAAMPEAVVLSVYGDGWRDAVPLIMPLALSMPAYALMAMAGPLMQGLGYAGREAWAQAIGLVCMAVLLLLAADLSLVVAAWAVFASSCLRAWLVTLIAWRLLDVPGTTVWRILGGPLCLGLLAATLAAGIEYFLKEWPAPARLLTGFVVLSSGGLLSLMLARYLLCREARGVVLGMLPHLPAPLGRLLQQRLQDLHA
jgi:O-antigen/teichoic acid export membrane protein